MAFTHGKGTIVLVDEFNLSAYFRNVDFSVDVDTAETTTFGSMWKAFLAGQVGATFDLEGLFDPTQTVITDLLPTTAALITVVPGGSTFGRLANVLSTSVAESSPVGDIVSLTWSVLANGVAGGGAVLAAPTTYTGDTNGSTVDGLAATTTGAIAHLHVTDVDTDVDVTIQDSANASTWATIGTFAQKSAPGSERIVIAGTIRRYTRAVIDLTGTTTTLAVVMART